MNFHIQRCAAWHYYSIKPRFSKFSGAPSPEEAPGVPFPPPHGCLCYCNWYNKGCPSFWTQWACNNQIQIYPLTRNLLVVSINQNGKDSSMCTDNLTSTRILSASEDQTIRNHWTSWCFDSGSLQQGPSGLTCGGNRTTKVMYALCLRDGFVSAFLNMIHLKSFVMHLILKDFNLIRWASGAFACDTKGTFYISPPLVQRL